MSFGPRFIPGLGLAKGMALTLRRFFAPKATIQYPETPADVAPRFRGRLQLLYDEWGALKCETCFQCAQACPIECIDMGGNDTKGRYHIHWGPPETYGERREESALRRSGRPVPDRAYEHFEEIDLEPVRQILRDHDFEPKEMLRILEDVQDRYGYIPVAAIKEIAGASGAWYAFIYGTASYYRNFHWARPERTIGICRCTSCLLAGGGRVERAITAELGLNLGTGSHDLGLAFVSLEGHVAGAPSPLVTLDGEQQAVTENSAAQWARGLVGAHA